MPPYMERPKSDPETCVGAILVFLLVVGLGILTFAVTTGLRDRIEALERIVNTLQHQVRKGGL